MDNIYIRFAEDADAEDILGIYAPYIAETVVTFEYVVPSIEDFTQRVRQIRAEYPYLACVQGNQLVGYAYAHRYRERAAYQWAAEMSLYLRKSHFHCGLGKRLYVTMIDMLRLQNIRTVYGSVTLPNPNSEKLHEYLGFNLAGVCHASGYKCGRWVDVAWFEKVIGNTGPVPLPFRSFGEVDPEELAAILAICNRSQPLIHE